MTISLGKVKDTAVAFGKGAASTLTSPVGLAVSIGGGVLVSAVQGNMEADNVLKNVGKNVAGSSVINGVINVWLNQEIIEAREELRQSEVEIWGNKIPLLFFI